LIIYGLAHQFELVLYQNFYIKSWAAKYERDFKFTQAIHTSEAHKIFHSNQYLFIKYLLKQ